MYASQLPVQVNYDEKTGKGGDDASDYSAQSEESGEESGEEDMSASKVCQHCFLVPVHNHLHTQQEACHHCALCKPHVAS